MAEKHVTIPGVGEVSFPDSMSDSDIEQAIQKNILGQAASPQTVGMPPAPDVRGLSKQAVRPVPPVSPLEVIQRQFPSPWSIVGQRAPQVSQMIRGGQQMMGGTPRDIAGGASQMIRGGGAAVAPYALPASLAIAPVETLVGMGIGAAAGLGTEKAGTAVGAPPEYTALASDLANIMAGGMGPRMSAFLLNRVKLAPNPVSAAAELVKFADDHKIPLSAWVRTGIDRLRRWQARSAESAVASRSQAATRQAMEETASRLRQGPATTPEAAAGEVATELKTTRERHAAGAKQAYTQLDDIERASQEQVVTGHRDVDTGLLDREGKPITRREPITASIGLPVDMTGAKTAFSALVAPLEASMPLTQRQASVGLQALHNVLDGPDTLSASVADDFAGSIKTILRQKGVAPRTRYLLRQALDQLEPAIANAVAKGGPEAVRALAEGRQLTRAKYAAEGTMRGLKVPREQEFPLEPLRLFNKLTQAGDVNVGTLRRVQEHAPDSLPAVGRAMLEGLFDQVFGKGVDYNPATALKAWNKLGDITKGILFKPQQIAELNRFFGLAETESKTPRATGAPPGASPHRMLDILAAAAEATGLGSGHGDLTSKIVGGYAVYRGARWLGSRMLAETLWNPDKARMLTDGISTRLFSIPGAGAAAMTRGEVTSLPSEKPRRGTPRRAPQPVTQSQPNGSTPAGARAFLPARGATLVPSLAQAIQRKEGWSTGSRSQRNNNPGNLKPAPGHTLPGMVGVDAQGFARFSDYNSGWNALLKQVDKQVRRGDDLNQFFATYAPEQDRNNPGQYAAQVGSWLGLDPSKRLSSLR